MQEDLIRESANYQPKDSLAEQLEFVRQNLHCMNFTREHAQSEHRTVYCLFTLPSQHVYGNCLEELLDNAIEAAKETSVADGERHADRPAPPSLVAHGYTCLGCE